MALSIAPMTVTELEVERPALVALLRDAVESGASVGFLPPLEDAEAVSYWRAVADELRDGTRVVLGARSRARARGRRPARARPARQRRGTGPRWRR